MLLLQGGKPCNRDRGGYGRGVSGRNLAQGKGGDGEKDRQFQFVTAGWSDERGDNKMCE